MCGEVELLGDGVVEGGVVVAVHIAPERGDTVDVGVVVCVS